MPARQDIIGDDLLRALRVLLRPLVSEVVAEMLGAAHSSTEVSSVRLPPDTKGPDSFNRACRQGRVRGARKVGRVWICTLEAWSGRAAASRPRGIPASVPRAARDVTVTQRDEPSRGAAARDADVLRELGLEHRRTG